MVRLQIFALLLMSLILGACQTRPTTGRDNPDRRMQAAEQMLEPIQITPSTVVVDARPRFEYSVAHIPKSVSLQWSEFTEPDRVQRGILQRDLFSLTRRLSRAGIGPDTPVVVVGRGLQGEAEEGRVAWMLAYLGVRKIQFAAMGAFKARVTNEIDEQGLPSVPIWQPETIESLNVTRDELRYVINKRGVNEAIAAFGGGALTRYTIIDVRSAAAYLGREKTLLDDRPIPNMDAVNIPWAQFFTSDFRPNPGLKDRLLEVGIKPENRIIVIDENGVASAAVTMALRALGYTRAGNYAGGLTDFMSAY